MSTLAINAAPFESSNGKFVNNKKNIPKATHRKTQRFKEGMKMDKAKIQTILDDIHDAVDESDDDEQELGDFNPPSPPISSGTEKTKLLENNKEKYDENLLDDDEAQEYETPSVGTKFKENFASIHDNVKILNNENKYKKESGSSYLGNNDVLMNKINYMTQLLEEQHDEKTNNVTEEVILYSFLGVFIIFVIDSFANMGGKYKR